MPPDQQRPAAAAGDVGQSRPGPRPGTADAELLVGIDQVHQVVAAPGPARPRVGLAVPMSMPRYTAMESTETSSTSRSGRGRARASARLPRRGGAHQRHRSGRGGIGPAPALTQPAATGMRVRWDGPASRRPARREMVRAASVTATVGVGPGAGRRRSGGAKWTSLFWRGPAGDTSGSRLARPLHHDLLDPADAGPVPGRAERSTTTRSLSKRSATTSSGRTDRSWPPPGCPGRGEKMKV